MYSTLSLLKLNLIVWIFKHKVKEKAPDKVQDVKTLTKLLRDVQAENERLDKENTRLCLALKEKDAEIRDLKSNVAQLETKLKKSSISKEVILNSSSNYNISPNINNLYSVANSSQSNGLSSTSYNVDNNPKLIPTSPDRNSTKGEKKSVCLYVLLFCVVSF